ncbi:MAG: hypothetical protein AAGA30_07610, partial [Planctomycetota bacterium]
STVPQGPPLVCSNIEPCNASGVFTLLNVQLSSSKPKGIVELAIHRFKSADSKELPSSHRRRVPAKKQHHGCAAGNVTTKHSKSS